MHSSFNIFTKGHFYFNYSFIYDLIIILFNLITLRQREEGLNVQAGAAGLPDSNRAKVQQPSGLKGILMNLG